MSEVTRILQRLAGLLLRQFLRRQLAIFFGTDSSGNAHC
jgi:hypothetical protein